MVHLVQQLADGGDWSSMVQVRQLCHTVRWELLTSGYLDAKWVVDQWWLFDPKLPLRGIPTDFLFLEADGDGRHIAELQSGLLLMLYIIHVEHLDDTGYGKKEPERDRLVLDLLDRIKPANDDVRRLMECIHLILRHYHQAKFCTHSGVQLGEEDLAIRNQLYSDMDWLQRTLVVDYFEKELLRLRVLSQ